MIFMHTMVRRVHNKNNVIEDVNVFVAPAVQNLIRPTEQDQRQHERQCIRDQLEEEEYPLERGFGQDSGYGRFLEMWP